MTNNVGGGVLMAIDVTGDQIYIVDSSKKPCPIVVPSIN